MKAIKYFVFGVMLMLAGAPVMAQNLTKEDALKQVKEILKAKSADADKEVAKIAKNFKKDGVTLSAIGRAYYDQKNYTKAEEYADMALDKTKQKCAEAWVLKGDLAMANDNGGKAAEMFQQAMYFDQQNPAGYTRYASMMSKADPNGSVETLKQLGQNVPDYPWQLEAAKIYDRAGKVGKALEYYEQVPVDKMENGDLGSYATSLYLSGKFQKALDIAEFGAKKAPRYAAFNRLGLFTNTELKNYDAALAYGEKLFHASDSAKYSAFDYKYEGLALIGAKKYDQAIEVFKQMAALKGADAATKADAYSQIADAYTEMENYKEAVKYYNLCLDTKPDATANDYATFGTIYTLLTNQLTGDDQKKAYTEADDVYVKMIQKFPDAKEFGVYKRATLAGIMDPELKYGVAKPLYDELIDVITTDGRIEGPSKTRLLQAYTYNMIYSLKTLNKVADAKQYATKVLELDPENEQAKMVMTLK